MEGARAVTTDNFTEAAAEEANARYGTAGNREVWMEAAEWARDHLTQEPTDAEVGYAYAEWMTHSPIRDLDARRLNCACGGRGFTPPGYEHHRLRAALAAARAARRDEELAEDWPHRPGRREGDEPMNEKTIYDMTGDHLEAALVGKSITATSEDSITLSDGTVLHIEDTSDCCAWFTGSVRSIDLSDNIVTGVREDDRDGDEWTEHYTLTILSHTREIAAVDIDGDPTSGYYCHSVDLRIAKEERIKANARADQAEAGIKAVRDLHRSTGLTEHAGPRIQPDGTPIPDDTLLPPSARIGDGA